MTMLCRYIRKQGNASRLKPLAAVVLAVCALALAGCSEPPKEAEPVIRPVKTMTVPDTVSGTRRTFPGKVVATEKVSLSFRVPGQVVELPIKEGDLVKKGQLVAKLDQNDYLTQLKNAQSLLHGARSRAKEAQSNYNRSKKLVESGTIARADFDNAASVRDTANAEVNSLIQQVRQAKLNMEYTTLEASFDGVIAAKYIKNFQTVQAKEPIVQLEDLSAVDIIVEVPEFIYAVIRNSPPGSVQPVASFEALPGKAFPVTAKEFQTRANPETQTYTVTLTMAQPEGTTIYPGMTAEITGAVPMGIGIEGVFVPVDAVFGDSAGNSTVWILDTDSMTVHAQGVKIGSLSGDSILVLEGLKPGETLITAGANSLEEGQVVRKLKGRIGKEK